MTDAAAIKKSGSFLGITKPILLWGVVTFFILAVVIFIAGYLDAINKAPWPEEATFDEAPFAEASVTFKDAGSFQILDLTSFKSFVASQLETEAVKARDYSFDKALDAKYSGTLVLWAATPSGDSSVVDRKWAAAAASLKQQIASLEAQIEAASYFDRQGFTDDLEKALRKQRFMESMGAYMKATRASAPIRFPGRGADAVFSFVVGQPRGFSLDDSGGLICRLTDAHPAYKASFLKASGVSEERVAAAALDQDEAALKSILREARQQFNEDLKSRRDQIREELAEQRASLRESFYERWFVVWGTGLATYFAFFMLLRYFGIIRRKKLPRKSTYEIYFATNTTSVVFRVLALIIIVLGLATLIVNLLGVIARTGLQSYDVFRALASVMIPIPFQWDVLLGIIKPFLIVINAVVASWIFVLVSEFICFMSSCYHIAYRRSTKDME
jgi:hypothetical protein